MLVLGNMMSRRALTIGIVFVVFFGTLLLASHRLSDACPNGRFCPDITGSRHKPQPQPLPKPVADGQEKQKEVVTDPSAPPKSVYDTTVNYPSGHFKGSEHPAKIDPKTDPLCANFPDTSNVLVIMKTGASEAYSKVPTQLLTNLRCLNDFLLFSDMEQTVAGYHIHDSLNKVNSTIMYGNDDFEIYLRQQKCMVDQEACNKDYDTAKKGWALDKYKNVHIAEKTYEMRPNYDWYLYVDADTYIVWSTMVQYLKQLDRRKPLYLGSVALLGGYPFGHGGSGYLVSQAGMRKMFKDKTGVANAFDVTASETCCGDYVFAKAIKETAGIKITQQWPTINGEKPSTFPFGSDGWCQPIATMHHISSEELSDLDAFERSRGFKQPVRVHEIYDRFVKSKLTAASNDRDEWDNMSEDRIYLNATAKKYDDWLVDRTRQKKGEKMTELEEVAHHDFESCKKACESVHDCYQYLYYDGTCRTTWKWKHGKPVKKIKPTDDFYKSGWDLTKIQKWIDDTGKCGKIEWPSLS